MKGDSVNKYTIGDIASNLTKDEFLGYCKGNLVRWDFEIIRGKSTWNLSERVNFWENAFDRYSHKCKLDNGK